MSNQNLERYPLIKKAFFLGGDFFWALRKKQGNKTVRFMGYVLRKVFRRCFNEVTVNFSSFPQESSKHSYLVLPSHRSYFDFLLCSFVFFEVDKLEINLPHIAGTEDFFKLPIIGQLFRNAHSFPIRRGLGREDPGLTDTVHKLLNEKATLEFFVEGTRSRSRQFLTPKHGLLKCIQNSGKNFTLLPIKISYEKIAEEESFYKEIRTGQKPKVHLKPLLKWAWKLALGKISLGNVHIQAGNTIELTPEADLNQTLQQVMSELQRNTVITSYHCYPESAADKITFHPSGFENVGGEKDFLESWCLQNQWIHHFFSTADRSNPWINAYLKRNYYFSNSTTKESIEPQILEEYFKPLLTDVAQICHYISQCQEFPEGDLYKECSLLLGKISIQFTLSCLLEYMVLERPKREFYLRISEIDPHLMQHLEKYFQKNYQINI